MRDGLTWLRLAAIIALALGILAVVMFGLSPRQYDPLPRLTPEHGARPDRPAKLI